MPLFEVHRSFVLSSRVLHAEETPILLLDPGSCMWACARGALDTRHGVVYDFCPGRGGRRAKECLKG